MTMLRFDAMVSHNMMALCCRSCSEDLAPEAAGAAPEAAEAAFLGGMRYETAREGSSQRSAHGGAADRRTREGSSQRSAHGGG